MASPTRGTWVWISSGSWWWTGRPGVLQSTQSQRVRHDWATELNWCILSQHFLVQILFCFINFTLTPLRSSVCCQCFCLVHVSLSCSFSLLPQTRFRPVCSLCFAPSSQFTLYLLLFLSVAQVPFACIPQESISKRLKGKVDMLESESCLPDTCSSLLAW